MSRDKRVLLRLQAGDRMRRWTAQEPGTYEVSEWLAYEFLLKNLGAGLREVTFEQATIQSG